MKYVLIFTLFFAAPALAQSNLPAPVKRGHTISFHRGATICIEGPARIYDEAKMQLLAVPAGQTYPSGCVPEK